MKKLTALLLALCALLLALCACGMDNGAETEGAKIYFIAEDRNGRKYLDYEIRTLAAESAADSVFEIIGLMKEPQTDGAKPAITPEICVSSVKIKGYTLSVEFSEEYDALDSVRKMLAASAICCSLLDSGEIEYVSISSAGKAQPPVYEGYLFKDKIMASDRIVLGK